MHDSVETAETPPINPCFAPREIRRALQALGTGPFIIIGRKHGVSAGERSTAAQVAQTLDEAVALATLIAERGGSVYVHRNPIRDGQLYLRDSEGRRCASPRGRYGNPPEVDDVEAIEWIPIDIDPADGAPLEAARAHARELIDALGQEVDLHYILDSGRGLQAGIRLMLPAKPGSEAWEAALSLADRVYIWLERRANQSLVHVDPIGRNPNRFTRLAGTPNRKTRQLARLLAEPGHSVLDPKRVLREVIAPERCSRADQPQAGIPLPLKLLDQILSHLHVRDYGHRDDWLRIAFGVRTVFGDAGWESFDQWSAGDSDAYDEDGNQAIWESCDESREGGVGLGTLVYELKRAAEARPNERGEIHALIARIASRSDEPPEFPE